VRFGRKGSKAGFGQWPGLLLYQFSCEDVSMRLVVHPLALYKSVE
jgi:hypothetical protein